VTEPHDPTLDVLLDLDGQVLVVDPDSGHWIRFVVTLVPVSPEKPHGIDYSLTLHGPDGGGWSDSITPIRPRGRTWRAAGPSSPAADDQGLRVPGRNDVAR
jgi:hypothetical protein